MNQEVEDKLTFHSQSGDPADLGAELSDPSTISDESLLEALRIAIPGYEIVARVADGGQGTVFRALRQADNSIVAIKTLNHGLFANKESRIRFKREANALKVLNHPGIVKLIESGETSDGCNYIVTEFIEGQHLDKYVASLPRETAMHVKLRIMVSLLHAIEAAHKCSIIHRDLSPTNVLVDSSGEPRVIDFGLARSAFDILLDPAGKVSSVGDFFGKLDFASPEQISGGVELTQSSDVYALGVILYLLLSDGRLPFNHGGGSQSLASRIACESADPLPRRTDISHSVWRDLCVVVQRAMAKRPEDRFQNAGEMVRTLAPIQVRYEAGRGMEGMPTGSEIPIEQSSVKTGGEVMLTSKSVTSYHMRMQLVEWAKEVRRILQLRADSQGVAQLDQAIAEFLQERFTIAVIGKAKRGKSTLLNAMLGRKDDLVAPTDKLPASNAITKIFFDETEFAEVLFHDETPEIISYERIREFVTEEENPNNRKNVACVNVSGPFPGLDRDLALVDTPGADSLHDHHDALLYGFIPNADAVIFLVSARMPIDEHEKALLRRIKAADVKKVFFAVNRIDELSPSELEQAVTHNASELSKIGISVSKVHEISAKRAFLGDYVASGLPGLCGEMQKFLMANKGRVLGERFIKRVLAIAGPVRNGIEVELKCIERTSDELEFDLNSLQIQHAAIQEKQKYGEREFLNQWQKAVDAFEVDLPIARDEVLSKVLSRIENSSTLRVGALAKELPSIISEAVEACTAPIAFKFESTVQESCRKYAESIPTIEIGLVSPTIRGARSDSLLPGALGGTSAVAVGGVLINAAAAYVPATATTVITGSAAPAAYQATAAGIGTLMSWIGGLFGSSSTTAAGTAVSGMFTTTTAVNTVAATPLWVTLAGPVGWTMIGVGAIAVPLAWRLSKLKQKDKIRDAAESEITRLFQRLKSERASALRRLGEATAKDIALSLERDFDQVRRAIASTAERRPSPAGVDQLRRVAHELNSLLEKTPVVS